MVEVVTARPVRTPHRMRHAILATVTLALVAGPLTATASPAAVTTSHSQLHAVTCVKPTGAFYCFPSIAGHLNKALGAKKTICTEAVAFSTAVLLARR